MLRLIGAPMWPSPMKATFMSFSLGYGRGSVRRGSGRWSGRGPAADRGLVDLRAQPRPLRHAEAAVGVDANRFGQEEVAAGHRPAGRIVGELQVRDAADPGHQVQVS